MNSFYRGKTVLITGAAGFLGSHLLERLRTWEANVVALDVAPVPEAVRDRSTSDPGLRYERLDISRDERLGEVIREERPEVLFHLAAIASPRACARDFVAAYRVNVEGTFNVLRFSEGVGHVVFLSSAAVYGASRASPMDENHPLAGRDPYAITKILGETLCRNYSENYGYNCSIVRNFNAFGPRQAPEYVIPTIIRQALSEGRIELWNAAPVRDLMYVENTADAILTIGSQGRGSTFNVGSGRGIRIGELAHLIAQRVGDDVPVNDLRKEVVGSPSLVADVHRLQTLGWTERVPFDIGLSETVQWYRG